MPRLALVAALLASPVVVQRDEPAASASGGHTLAWLTLGAGTALLAGGIAAHVVREQNAAIYDDDARCLVPGQTRDQVCGSYRNTVDVSTALAVIGYAAGGAAVQTSACLLRDALVPTGAGVGDASKRGERADSEQSHVRSAAKPRCGGRAARARRAAG